VRQARTVTAQIRPACRFICGRDGGDYELALDAPAERLQSTPAMLDV
jgi:hypothetical protein